ncbi:putative small GTPase, sigma-54 interaction domain, ATP-binding site 1 [Septoria linicola]|nr:putative small GTPase, sigma-54 interaction domain, ATP-binding site 1 [Septoria linicola]
MAAIRAEGTRGPTEATMRDAMTPMSEAPVVPVLLLGDSGVGKSTFISRLTKGHAYRGPLPQLRDLDQPFAFNIRMYNRPYRFEFYDTASPENFTLLKPSMIILCYSIADPATLTSIHTKWKHEVETHFNYDESLPVVVLGLKRDIRSQEDYGGTVRQPAVPEDQDDDAYGDDALLNGRTFVYPQEALRIAQEMRCDMYAECSALTGELCEAAIEDISRRAGRTTTAKGGKTEGTQCVIL